MARNATPRRRARTGKPGIGITDRRDGAVYEIWTKETGWRTYDDCRSLDDAVAKRAELIYRKHRGENIRPTPRDLTFRAAAEAYLQHAATRPKPLASNTLSARRTTLEVHLAPAFGDLRLDKISVEMVARLVSDMQTSEYRTEVNRRRGISKPEAEEGYAAWTISGTLATIKVIYAYAARRLGYAGLNPSGLLTGDERPECRHVSPAILSRAELEAVIARAAEEDERFAVAIGIGGYLGLRLGEVLGLRWADVDLTPGRELLKITAQLDAKRHVRVKLKTNSAYREIEVEAGVANMLREHKLRSTHTAPDDYVLNVNGEPLRRRALQRRGLERAQQRAQITTPITFHGLRHGHGSALVLAAWADTEISRRLGHASVIVTRSVYLQEFEAMSRTDDRRARLNALYAREAS